MITENCHIAFRGCNDAQGESSHDAEEEYQEMQAQQAIIDAEFAAMLSDEKLRVLKRAGDEFSSNMTQYIR